MKNDNEGVTISFKEEVLAYLDEYCRINDLTRSQVVSKAVRRFLLSESGDRHDRFRSIMNMIYEKSKV
jgi:metal-responsive CopG/Arc/MetJ family transcriptional regulator